MAATFNLKIFLQVGEYKNKKKINDKYELIIA